MKARSLTIRRKLFPAFYWRRRSSSTPWPETTEKSLTIANRTTSERSGSAGNRPDRSEVLRGGMAKPGKVEQLISTLVRDLNDDELDLLSNELSAARESRRPVIELEQITHERLRDPEFKKAVLSTIERATRQL